jgi:predicted nuclease of predicted toxin-antitoxin system
LRFFIDECLSRQLARRLNALGFDAIHPLDVGRRGEPDHRVVARCLEEDRIIVTQNAGDFRKLVGRQEIHPGLVVLPNIGREGTWTLLRRVLALLEAREDGRTFMINRVIEVAADGGMAVFERPPAR